MNIQAEKLKLIEWIAKVQDFKTIEKVLKIQREAPYDWWDDLTDFEKKEIELGLADIEQGNTVDHSEVRKIYEKYL
jgi:predicted transcriptional regulator